MSYDAIETSVHDAQPVELYRFVRGVEVWTQTSADEPIVYQSETYTPVTMQRSAPVQSHDADAGRLSLTVARDHPVAQLFRVIVPAGTVGLTIYRQHRGDGECLTWWQGRVRAVAWSGSRAVMQCDALGAMLQRPGLRRHYGAPCGHMLYDGGCGLNAESYKTVATVSSISGNTITSAAFAGQADGYFTAGYLRYGDDDFRMILDHAGSTVTVLLPFEDLAVGDTLYAYAGCDHVPDTCKNKFANFANYGGWPFVPIKNPFQVGLEG